MDFGDGRVVAYAPADLLDLEPRLLPDGAPEPGQRVAGGRAAGCRAPTGRCCRATCSTPPSPAPAGRSCSSATRRRWRGRWPRRATCGARPAWRRCCGRGPAHAGGLAPGGGRTPREPGAVRRAGAPVPRAARRAAGRRPAAAAGQLLRGVLRGRRAGGARAGPEAERAPLGRVGPAGAAVRRAHHALDTFLARLLARGYRVAVSDEEAPDAPGAGAGGRRPAGCGRAAIVRTLTPGTVTDPALLRERPADLPGRRWRPPAAATAGSGWPGRTSPPASSGRASSTPRTRRPSCSGSTPAEVLVPADCPAPAAARRRPPRHAGRAERGGRGGAGARLPGRPRWATCRWRGRRRG